jgi:hypothetical protein
MRLPISGAEKQKRRRKALEKRRKRGRNSQPLPPRKKGTDNAWKEFKTVTEAARISGQALRDKTADCQFDSAAGFVTLADPAFAGRQRF